MRLREVLVATLIAGCGSVSDNSPDAPPPVADTTPPMIIGSHPDKMSTKASVILPVSVLFDEPLDPATVSATTVTARYATKQSFYDTAAYSRQDNVGVVATGSVAYDDVVHKVVYTPLVPLPFNSRIDVTLDGIKDVHGNALAATHLVFDTLANNDRFWTFFDSNGAVFQYIDFGTMGGVQTHYTVSSSPGTDTLWFTADDPLLGRYSNTYDATNRMTSTANYSGGPDGQFFTADDVETQLIKANYDATDHLAQIVTYSGAGTDTMWGTADDVPSYYYQASWQGDHYVGQIQFTNPGLDGQWLTADDKTNSSFIKYQYDAMGHRSRSVTYTPGTDQLPGTADDTIIRYDDMTTDSYGRVIRDVIRAIGPDAQWFTPDDTYSSYTKVIVDSKNLPVQSQRFTSPGPDAMWLTADDVQTGLTVTMFNAAGQSIEDDGMAAGPDAMYGTSDDIVTSVTTTTYDASGARISNVIFTAGPDGKYKTADDGRNELITFDTSN